MQHNLISHDATISDPQSVEYERDDSKKIGKGANTMQDPKATVQHFHIIRDLFIDYRALANIHASYTHPGISVGFSFFFL